MSKTSMDKIKQSKQLSCVFCVLGVQSVNRFLIFFMVRSYEYFLTRVVINVNVYILEFSKMVFEKNLNVHKYIETIGRWYRITNMS